MHLGHLANKPRTLAADPPRRSDDQGRALGFLLTGGEASDYAAAEPLMKIPIAKPKALHDIAPSDAAVELVGARA